MPPPFSFPTPAVVSNISSETWTLRISSSLRSEFAVFSLMALILCFASDADTVLVCVPVPSGMRLEFGGAISGNMRLSFQAARSIG